MHKTVIIYGGAFNPPTRAHQAIVKRLVKEAGCRDAELWLMPSGSRDDKAIKTAYETRIAYIEALIESVNTKSVNVKIETTELDRDFHTETYDSVQELGSRYPDTKFLWVFGVDSVLTMKQWHHGTWLYDNLEMIAIARHGYVLDDIPPKATQLTFTMPVVSSTQVRKRLEQGHSVRSLVPKPVYTLLSKNLVNSY